MHSNLWYAIDLSVFSRPTNKTKMVSKYELKLKTQCLLYCNIIVMKLKMLWIRYFLTEIMIQNGISVCFHCPGSEWGSGMSWLLGLGLGVTDSLQQKEVLFLVKTEIYYYFLHFSQKNIFWSKFQFVFQFEFVFKTLENF